MNNELNLQLHYEKKNSTLKLKEISFLKNKKRFRFTHQNQEELLNIADILKKKLYQVGFNDHFKVTKLIGKGSFGNVNKI